MASSPAAPDREDDRARDASIVREEARHVVESQLAVLRETDRKAMATARVVAVILGLLLSAASLADAPGNSLNRWHVVGSASLLGSLLVAVMTYSVDRPSLGVGSGYLDTVDQRLESDDSEELELLHRCAEWIADNNEKIGSNSTYLLVSQWLLVLGLAAIAVGMYRLIWRHSLLRHAELHSSMSGKEESGRPETTRIYKGPRWLVDRLPRFGSPERDTDGR